MKRILKNKYFITTIITIFLYLIFMKINNIHPFGINSILKSDLYKQYVNFLGYFKEVLLNNSSIFFSWNMGMGNNFFTTFAYYLTSPLNVLTVLFSAQNMDIFVTFLILIKIILIGNSMVFFLSKTYKIDEKYLSLLGIAYSFSSYVIIYGFHIMWLDSLYILPIIMYLVKRYISGGKLYPIILATAFAIFTNYYIGVSASLFTGIYFIGEYIINNEFRSAKDFKKFLLKTILIGMGIGLAFGLNMVIVLPSFLQVSSTISTLEKFSLGIRFEKLYFFTNTIFNNYVSVFQQYTGLFFVSTISLVLIPLYYFNKNIKLKEKIIYTIILGLLFLPMISELFNRIWHGFTIPNGFKYRHSYTIVIITIIMCFRQLQNSIGTRKRGYIVGFIIITAIWLLQLYFSKQGLLLQDNFKVSEHGLIIAYLSYILILFMMYLMNEKNLKIAKILVISLFIIDVIISIKSGANNMDPYFKRIYFTQYDNLMEHLKTKIENPKTDRIVFFPDEYGENMSLKFGYSGIGYFSSSRNRENLRTMSKLGYNVQLDSELWITSVSGTHFNYDMGNVKFMISKNIKDLDEKFGFEFLEKFEDFYIYKNKNYLNFIYYQRENTKLVENPFENLNNIVKNLGFENDEQDYFENIEETNLITLEKEKVMDEDIYKVKANSNVSIYFEGKGKLELSVDGKMKYDDYLNIWTTDSGIKQIKKLNKNDEVEFKIKNISNSKINIFVSNDEKIEEKIQKNRDNIKINKLNVLKRGLDVEFESEKEGLLTFAIPYDKGFRVFINKKEINPEKMYDGAYLGIKTNKGKNNIHIFYEVRGLINGQKLSLVSFVILFMIIAFEKRGKDEKSAIHIE